MGDKLQETGGRGWEISYRRLEAGDGRQATGDWRQGMGDHGN